MDSQRGWIERIVEGTARGLARRTSRRSFLSRVGTVLVGASAVPLLPVARARAQAPDESGLEGDAGDPASCGYWRHCAIDGFLSSCCGGSQNACPPGTEMAPITWIGTCRNPSDGREYVISYNDCCGQAFCGRCVCQNDEGDKPVYVTPRSNDINWCMGASSQAYNSTVAIVLGVATE